MSWISLTVSVDRADPENQRHAAAQTDVRKRVVLGEWRP
jgi:hypothetical protein